MTEEIFFIVKKETVDDKITYKPMIGVECILTFEGDERTMLIGEYVSEYYEMVSVRGITEKQLVYTETEEVMGPQEMIFKTGRDGVATVRIGDVERECGGMYLRIEGIEEEFYLNLTGLTGMQKIVVE